jgi:hypothetical protein
MPAPETDAVDSSAASQSLWARTDSAHDKHWSGQLRAGLLERIRWGHPGPSGTNTGDNNPGLVLAVGAVPFCVLASAWFSSGIDV